MRQGQNVLQQILLLSKKFDTKKEKVLVKIVEFKFL